MRFTFIVSLALCCGLRAQAPSTNPPAFEVASVKPHPASPGAGQTSITGDHGRLVYINVTVRTCIRQAYGLRIYPAPTPSDPLAAEKFDIVAKASDDPSKQETMRMLQTLLADRFKLAVHRETKELPIYALVQSKTKPKLHEAQDDGTAPEIGAGGGHQIAARRASMTQLAAALRGWIGDSVVDETGLTGRYDVTLDFNPDENLSAEGPTIFEAVERQLGLKLEARKGPVEVIVTDRVEKPTAN